MLSPAPTVRASVATAVRSEQAVRWVAVLVEQGLYHDRRSGTCSALWQPRE